MGFGGHWIWSVSELGEVVGLSEYCNEHSGSIKCGKFID
jgi:hypothetical protein